MTVPVLADLAARLEDLGRRRPLVLAGTALACPALDDVLDAIGASGLALDRAAIEPTSDQVLVSGRASLFGLHAVEVRATFAGGDADGLSVALRAAFVGDARPGLVELPWASIGELFVEASATGPSVLLPIVSVVLGGTILLEGRPDPIAVTLRPRVDRAGWLLRAADIPLPDPAAIAGLLGVKDAGPLMPERISSLGGFSIVELLCRIRPDWSVDSLGVTVAAPGKEWELAPGFKLGGVRLGIGLDREGADESDGSLGADGPGNGGPRGALTRVGASLGATVTLGTASPVDLPVRIARDGDEWRLGILGAHGFPSVGDLVAAADASAAAALPAGLSALRMDEASVEVALGAGDPTIRRFFFSARLADHWPIIEDHLALERVAFELDIDRVSGDTSGFITGAIRLDGVELPVAARKPAGGGPWTLELSTAETPSLGGGLSALGGAAGGDDLADHLPQGLAGGAVALHHLSIEFDPRTHSVAAVDVEVHAPGPWPLPGFNQVDARDLTLKLRVTSPGDASQREVTGEISGTAILGGPAVKISASKAPGAAGWELTAELDSGSSISLSALTRRVSQGLPPPDVVKDLALSRAKLTLTPATGAFALTAGSAGPWPVPVGFAGLQVGDLHFDLRRARAGANLTGVVGGRIAIAGAQLAVDYALPGDLVLTGHVDSLRLSRLAADLAGPGLVEKLPIPAWFKDLELRDLDVSLAPGPGRFMASATVQGFAAAAFLVQKGNRGGWGFAFALAPSPSWRLSSLSPGLHALDGLSFGNTVLIVSTADDASPIRELPVVRERLGETGALTVGHGLTLVADLSLDGTGADQILGMKHLRVRAVMGDPAAALVLEAALAGPFDLGGGVVLQKVDFHLTTGTQGIELGLLGQIDVVAGPNKLTFTGGLAVRPNGATCAVTMAGVWHEPFGAKGVKVADVALELGISYQGVPDIAVKGHVEIGTFHGDLAVKFHGEDPSQSMLALSFNRLKLADLVTSLCHEVFHDAIPEAIVQTALDITFEDVDIAVVPRTTTIGGTTYEQGTRLSGRMFFWGLKAEATVEVDYQKGLRVDGHVDPLELGDVFALRGTDGNARPSLYLEITTGKVPAIDVNGEVSLLGLTRATTLSLTDKGFHFEVTGKIFGRFTCGLAVQGGHLNDTAGFFVRASMENDLLAYLREHAEAALKAAAQGADSALAEAQRQLREAQTKVASLDRQIAARWRAVEAERTATRRTNVTAQAGLAQAKRQIVEDLGGKIGALAAAIRADRARDIQRLADARRDVQRDQRKVDTLLGEINRVRAIIHGERDLATRRMKEAQAGVNAAQHNVDAILKTIQVKERWWNGLPAADVPWKPSKAREAAGYYPMIGSMWATYGTATVALKAATGVLEGIKQGARLTPIEMDLRIAGLYATYGVATAGLQTATGAVKALQGVLDLPPVELDPRLVALNAQRAAAQAELEGILSALKLLQSGLDILPIDLDPVILSLTATRGTALLALKAAEGVLEATRITVGGALQVSQYIAHYGLGGLIDVRRASFESSLEAIHGGAVRLAADVEFLGQPHHVEFGMNFHDPLSGVTNLVRELMPA